jgi:hypothetical protein
MLADVGRQVIRLIKIKSGQGVQMKFPDDDGVAEFIDRCCVCGHTCKTIVKFDYNHKVIDVVWYKMDGEN